MKLLVLHENICCSISAVSAAIPAFSLLIPLASVQNCLACYHLLKTADIMDFCGCQYKYLFVPSSGSICLLHSTHYFSLIPCHPTHSCLVTGPDCSLSSSTSTNSEVHSPRLRLLFLLHFKSLGQKNPPMLLYVQNLITMALEIAVSPSKILQFFFCPLCACAYSVIYDDGQQHFVNERSSCCTLQGPNMFCPHNFSLYPFSAALLTLCERGIKFPYGGNVL